MIRTIGLISCLLLISACGAQILYESTQVNRSDGDWEKKVSFEFNDTYYNVTFLTANDSCIYYSYNTTPQVCDIKNTVIEKLALNHPWVH